MPYYRAHVEYHATEDLAVRAIGGFGNISDGSSRFRTEWFSNIGLEGVYQPRFEILGNWRPYLASGAATDFGTVKNSGSNSFDLDWNFYLPVELGVEYLFTPNLSATAFLENRLHSVQWDKLDGVATGGNYYDKRDELPRAGLGLTWRFGFKAMPIPVKVVEAAKQVAAPEVAKVVPLVDSDHDGIADALDKCAGTPAGTKVDSTGCVEIKFEKGTKLTLDGILFASGISEIDPSSDAVLTHAANAIKAAPRPRSRSPDSPTTRARPRPTWPCRASAPPWSRRTWSSSASTPSRSPPRDTERSSPSPTTRPKKAAPRTVASNSASSRLDLQPRPDLGRFRFAPGTAFWFREWIESYRFSMTSLAKLLTDVRACTLCARHLPLGPRPVVQLETSARILIVGQAPGRRVHESGLPFDDPSGDRLRSWMGIDREAFYDPTRVAIVPMGFCYPGTGTSGDLPPRPECAATWRAPLLSHLEHLQLTLVIGRHALAYHLPDAKESLTETVQGWKLHGPRQIPMPHPSPRNNLWLKRNPWFEAELVPVLRERVGEILGLSA